MNLPTQDLRLAVRSLAKSPGFTLLAVLTLALGIGANTAIFSLVHSLFLRGLPFADSESIVRLYGEAPERNLQQLPFSITRFAHYRDGNTVFRDLTAEQFSGFSLTGLGDPVQVNGIKVSANYFSMLGVTPVRGRGFLPAEEDAADVAIITEAFWHGRLGGDPAVLGRGINLNGVSHTIVGVVPELPAIFAGANVEVFTTKPTEVAGTPRELLMRGVSMLRVLGRLKPGVIPEQAQASLRTLHESYRANNPEKADNSWIPVVVPIATDTTGNLRPAFTTLLAAVAFVLLIACSNVANLLLVRFGSRRREIAVRLALGAPRGRIIRLFVVESTLISLAAGVAGLAIADSTLQLVPALASNNLPLTNLELHGPVLAFALGLSVLTGIAMGLYPALQGSRTDVVNGLKDGGRAMTGGPAQNRFRRTLLATQVALSLVLLAGAGLLMTSFLRLNQQPAGFDATRIWTAALNLPQARYPDQNARQRLLDRFLEQLQTTPGIEAAAAVQGLPLTGANSRAPYARADGSPPPVNERPLGLIRSISTDYLSTLRIPLIAGRIFDRRDTNDGVAVVIISQNTARKLFPHEDPLGKRMFFGTNNGTGLLAEIVGVVGDVRSVGIAQSNDIEFYRPLAQRNFPFVQLAVRAAGDPAQTGATVRAVLKQLDPDLPLNNPQPFANIVATSLGQQRLLMTLLAAFAALALVLALVGIYGVVASTVEQRVPEFGVRTALGAAPGSIVRLMLKDGMKPVFVGVVVGLAAALLLGQLIASQLYEVSPRDPLLLGGTSLLLIVIAAFACWLPARRAARVDPLVALRQD